MVEKNVGIDQAQAGIENLNNMISNPLVAETSMASCAIDEYTKTAPRPKFDSDLSQILEVVRILNNVAPVSMPEYNFNADEINGEYFYKPDGNLLFIRDFDSDVIRDYYYNPNAEDSKYSISKILEHDKITGRLRVKIEPITRNGSKLKTNITIFDAKISRKYTLIQLSEGGIVNNISEFSEDGKSFQTLFRNINTLKPARYLEGKDNKQTGFTLIDCLFNNTGDIVRIKRYCNKKEINIDYTESEKHIKVKSY